MNQRIKRIRLLFNTLGLTAIAAAFIIALVSILEIRPRIEGLNQRLQDDLSFVDSALNTSAPGVQIANLLPSTLISLHGTLLSASESLQSGAKTTADVKKGITGLVMPKKALSQDTTHLSNLGYQLRLMAGVINQMQPPVRNLVQQLNQIPAQTSRIEGLRNALGQAALPTGVLLLGLGISASCFYFGVFCFSLAYAFSSVLLENQVSVRPLRSVA
jgi:hypothetical protein